jgi:hypothetical protein
MSDFEEIDQNGNYLDERLQDENGRQDYIRSMTRVSQY